MRSAASSCLRIDVRDTVVNVSGYRHEGLWQWRMSAKRDGYVHEELFDGIDSPTFEDLAAFRDRASAALDDYEQNGLATVGRQSR